MSDIESLPSTPVTHRGVPLLHDPVHNKGTAFTKEERARLDLRGLLPPRISSEELQVRRVMENLRGKHTDLERYILLTALQDRNENLFYRVVMDHLKELMPIIYTPTVGEACQKFGHIFRRPRGLYLSADDQGYLGQVMDNWPHKDVRVIVVTDELFAVAARALADIVSEHDLAMGRIFPSLARIRDVSAHIAVAVAQRVYELELSRSEPVADLEGAVRAAMYQPVYPDYAAQPLEEMGS